MSQVYLVAFDQINLILLTRVEARTRVCFFNSIFSIFVCQKVFEHLVIFKPVHSLGYRDDILH